MKLTRPTLAQTLVLLGVPIICLGQAGSLGYQRYLRCQIQADDLTLSEGLYRQKAGVCEELAPRLREVATLAREVAKSASSDFERKKWLEMARIEEEKAVKLDHEAVQLMTRADYLATQSSALSRVAWRPWLAEPE